MATETGVARDLLSAFPKGSGTGIEMGETESQYQDCENMAENCNV